MRCSKIDEMIERFYENDKDPILNKHINSCSDCSKMFDIIYSLDKIVLNETPSYEVEERVLNYAFRKVSFYNQFYYLKKISLALAFATFLIIYVFNPRSKNLFIDEFFEKANEIENEIRSVEVLLSYSSDFSDYLYFQKEEL